MHRLSTSAAALVVLATLAAGAVAALQDAPPPPPNAPAPAPDPKTQGAPPKPAPQEGQAPAPAPAPRPQQQRAPTATKPVGDVDLFREGQTAAVTRASAIVELDLSHIDMTADPVLVVDGQPIARADLDRQLCLMMGNNEIEQFITGVLLRRVKKEMAAAGQPVPQLKITEADVAKRFEDDKKNLAQMRGMSPEEYERQIKEAFGWANYVEFQKQQMEFESFFLPDPPKEWATKQQAEAKRLDDEQKARLEAEAKAEAEKKAQEGGQGGGDGPPPATDAKKPAVPVPVPEADLAFVPAKTWELLDPAYAKAIKDNYARGHELNPMIRGGIVAAMRKKLLEGVEVHAALPADGDAVLFCDGEAFRLPQLLALLSSRIDDQARRLALRELVNLRAVDLQLTKENALESEAVAAAAFEEFKKRFAGTLIQAEHAVLAFGFNSLWHYRGYFRRKHSYQTMVTAKMTDEKLVTHYEKAGRLFFENATCIAQVLFIPGEDRVKAKAEIDALLREVATGASFGAIAREKGKFPESANVKGGAIGPQLRGKLRQSLGESEYTSFLSGYSFADEAFYAAKEDSILGPVWRDLSPKLTGYLALHVDRFFTTGNKAAFTDPKMRERALEDYADVTFPRYVNEALGKCSVDVPPAKN